MKLFLKRIVLIIVTFITISCVISTASLWFLRQSSFYKPSFLVNDIEEQQFDYIVIGASTGLTTLNTKVIDSSLGITGLNLAMDDTALSSQYVMLQHFIAQGKKTDVCVLAPSIKDFNVLDPKLSGNDYRFLMYVQTPYVYDYYTGFDDINATLLKRSKWFPTLGVSYYNAELFYPSLQSVIQPEKRNRFDDKGNYVYPFSNNKNELISDLNPLNVEFSNPYLKKIEDLCKANDIRLVCYLTPIQGKKAIYNSQEFKIIDHSDLLQNKMYFFDNIHVDTRGRQIASKQFVKELGAFLK